MFRYTLSNDVSGSIVIYKDPKGWKESEQVIQRSPRFHGMNYSQVVSLSFICGSGKEFIDNIYNNIGIDSEIRIVIEESCDCAQRTTNASYNDDYNDDYEHGNTFSDCVWEPYYEGILDTKEIDIQEQYTAVPLIEQGLNQKFTSRLDTKIDLFATQTLDGGEFDNIPEPYILQMHSKALTNTGNFEVLNFVAEGIAIPPADATLFVNVQQFIASKDGDGFLENTTPPFLVNNTGALLTNLQPIYTSASSLPQDVTVRVISDGSVSFECFGTSENWNTQFLVVKGANANNAYAAYNIIPDRVLLYDSSSHVYDFTADTEVSFTLNPGENVWVVIKIENADGNFVVSTLFNDFRTIISSVDLAAPTTSKAQTIFESIAKVCQGVIGTEDPVRSSYYGRIGAVPHEEPENGCGAFAAITSGFLIRKYPDSYGCRLSITDTFNSLDAIDNIGIGFEYTDQWRLRWERKEYFYQDHEIIKLEHVPNIKRSVAQDLIYNDINIGFNKWATNERNGLDEYCAKSQYSIALKSVSNSLDKISPFIASAYIIEQIRRMSYNSFNATDTDYDNDVFIIALNRSLGYDGTPDGLNIAEKDENFTDIENVLSPQTAYNLRYYQAKNLLRNMGSISPVIAKEPAREVKFTSGEGNIFISTKDFIQCPSYNNGDEVAGNEDFPWDGVGEPPLYIPEYLAFDFPLSRTQFSDIKDALNNPDNPSINGYITISNETETFKGFIMEMKYRQINGLTTFKLLRKYGN